MTGYGSLLLVGIVCALGAGLLLAFSSWRGRSRPAEPIAELIVGAPPTQAGNQEHAFLGLLLLAPPIAFLLLWGLIPILNWRTVTVGIALGLVILVVGLVLWRPNHPDD